MKLELDVWHHPLDVYAKFQTDISQHDQKKVRKTFRWLGALVTPLSSVFVRQRAKNCPTMTKISKDQYIHKISVYQIWGLYVIFKAMNADKWLWPIFGCKVGQKVLIGMKLALDV